MSARYIAFVMIIFATIRFALFSVLEGALVFLIVAGISGFGSWLIGRSNPREDAIAIGIVAGSIAVLVAFFRMWAHVYHKMQDPRCIEEAKGWGRFRK